MQCPLDGETLMMTHRSGIEIDYCPKCRGVWLDRGELDKIVDMATSDVGAAHASAAPAPQPARPARDQYRDDRDRDDRDYRDDDRDDRRGSRKRRGSFLSELFDFD